MSYSVLVCDDDRDIVSAIEIYLTGEGYNVLRAHDGVEALGILEKNEVHLIIMDVMMPRMDGIRATMKIRENKNIPILILSAKSEDNDKILGLNIGADDYVTKPFNPLELLARVRSHLRRYTVLSGAPKKSGVLSSGALELDDAAKTVTVDGEERYLTPVEYAILKFLLENKGMVFSGERIYEEVRGGEAVGSDATIAVHVRRIREKIEINPREPRYLKVVWGHGYKIEKLD